MPLIGLIDENGIPFEWSDVEAGKGSFNDPGPVLMIMHKDRESYCDFSVTELLDDPYHVQMKRRFDYFERPEKFYDLIQGTMIHVFLEHSLGFEGSIKEKKMTKLMKAFDRKKHKVGGTLDLLENGTLWDYKSISMSKVKMMISGKIPDGVTKYYDQANCYYNLGLETGLIIRRIKIRFFVKDWRRYEFLKHGQDYKAYPKGFTVDVPIYDTLRTNSLMSKALNRHVKASKLSDNQLQEIGECDTWNNNLRCQEYCSFGDVCWFRRQEKAVKGKKTRKRRKA